MVATLAASLLAGCLGPGSWFPGGGPARPAGVHVLAPGNRSSAPAAGTVPLVVALEPRLDPATLRVRLVHGWPRPDRPPVDVTARLTRVGRFAVTTLTAPDLVPGLTTVEATARGRAAARGREEVGLATFSWEPQVDLTAAARCDFLATARCLFPFPNDAFTVGDPNTDTGRRVNLARESMPANAQGVHVDPTEWNRNDGFSPGSMILTSVPGLDLARTGAAPVTHIGRSLAPDQPIVLLDADTGERQPFFAELDAHADPTEGAALVVRPARNLTEGHRFVVALRGLRDGAGTPIPATRAFQLYRDRIPTFSAAIERRRPHVESLFEMLRRAGVARDGLYLAWDFTVASQRNLSERMLHIRDDAFASLDGKAPAFAVTSVENGVDDRIYRRVTGVFAVPNYLTGLGAPGSRFTTGPGGLPARNGYQLAGFICNIPRAASVDGRAPVHPARAAVYGHGLLGSNDEVNAGNVRSMANEHDFVFCATKWAGFSEDDIGQAALALTDWSNFPKVADRTQQGFLNFLFLGRLLRTSDGFASSPAFHADDRTPLVDSSDVFYDGNSQGAILGGAVTAVSTEWTRAVLGVPGMNYSTLLQRSSDFDTYQAILNRAYPSELDRMLSFSIVQMLWDRSEANGYAQHMTDDPYPGTPAHQVMLHVAFGDHQVANVTAEVEARTIGASARQPALAPGRDSAVTPLWGIPPVTSFPFGGSAIVYWDSGTPAPPGANVPPRPPQYGGDPHEDVRATPAARAQKSEFLRTGGSLVDVCGVGPCVTSAHP